jgi:hypothetical protein
MCCSRALFWVETVLLEPVLDVPSPDDYLPAYPMVGNASFRSRGIQELEDFGASEAKPGLELTTRQHVSFAGQLSSFFVAAHA